jgi:hypothetical protein
MSFNEAFDDMHFWDNKLIRGENGALAHQSLGDNIDSKLLELFTLMRGEDDINIINKISSILEPYINKEKLDINTRVNDLLKLTLLIIHIRDPRNGKGERKIFYTIMNYYWSKMPNTTKTLLPLLGSFGYWKDLVNIWEQTEHLDLKQNIIQCFSNQLSKDIESLDKDPNSSISLAGKWTPSEGKQYEKMAFKIAKKMNLPIPAYRKTLSRLRKQLNIVESLMCSKSFASIIPSKVPSVAVQNYRKAFLNEKSSKETQNEPRYVETDEEYADRNACRENFLKHLSSGGKIKSTVNELYTMVSAYFEGEKENPIIEAQWKERINKIRKSGINLPRMVPMSDLSGSMEGIPMMVSITLGIFTSELLDDNSLIEPAFANRFLTFDTEPHLVKLPRGVSLYEKVNCMKEWCESGRWGGSTNITSAIQKLLDLAIHANLQQDQMFEVLVIFSDMQFDMADNSWTNQSTSYELIKQQFEEAKYDMPHILFWNLRAKTQGFQVEANTPNTSMVSGYSSRMMNLFLSNSLETLKTSPVSLMLTAIDHISYKPYIPSLEEAIRKDLLD